MKKDIVIYQFSSREELSRAFADEVARNYSDHLRFWQSRTAECDEEYDYWERRLDTEVSVVHANAYMKVMDVLADVNDQTYAKKVWLGLKSRSKLLITRVGGFFDDLLMGAEDLSDRDQSESIVSSVPINTEYLLNRRTFSMTKLVYPAEVKYYT